MAQLGTVRVLVVDAEPGLIEDYRLALCPDPGSDAKASLDHLEADPSAAVVVERVSWLGLIAVVGIYARYTWLEQDTVPPEPTAVETPALSETTSPPDTSVE